MRWCKSCRESPTHRVALLQYMDFGHGKAILASIEQKGFKVFSHIVPLGVCCDFARPNKQITVMICREDTLVQSEPYARVSAMNTRYDNLLLDF